MNEQALDFKGLFRKWLESQPPDRIIGKAHLYCDCPMAIFFRSLGLNPITDLYGVTSGYIDLKGEYDPDIGMKKPIQIELPMWATKFVVLLDNRYDRNYPVTAQQALWVLDEASTGG